MNFVTWMAIAICGPGALFVLAWFLRDMLRLRREHRARSERGEPPPE